MHCTLPNMSTAPYLLKPLLCVIYEPRSMPQPQVRVICEPRSLPQLHACVTCEPHSL